MEEHALQLELESSLDSVDSAEETVLKEAGELGFDEDDLHRIGISVRECMVNAVVHGNRYNSKKKVRVSIARTPAQIIVRIADEGDGFDPTAIPDPCEGENVLRQSGRGVMMMQAFMDEFSISKLEPRGTEVKMVKYKTDTSNN